MPFDPRRHPRWPRGAPDDTSGDGQGGRFAEAGDLAGSIVGNLHGVTTGPWQQRASDQIGARRGEHPRMQYNQRIIDAVTAQMRDNQADQADDLHLNRMRLRYNQALASGDIAEQDASVDALRAYLESAYSTQHGGGLPAVPERREAPRSPQQDQRNRQALASGRQIQARIKAGNNGDPDEGLAIRIERLEREQGRTGRNVEADRAAADLERYILEDPEGLIAAHAHVPPPPVRRPEPHQVSGDEQAAYDLRQENDDYDELIHSTAVGLLGNLAGQGDQDEPNYRRLQDLIHGYEEARTDPSDPESIDTAADELASELADYDLDLPEPPPVPPYDAYPHIVFGARSPNPTRPDLGIPGDDEQAARASALVNLIQSSPPGTFEVQDDYGGYQPIARAYHENGTAWFATPHGLQFGRSPDDYVRYREDEPSQPPGDVGGYDLARLDAVDSRDLRDLAIEYSPTGMVDFTSAELDRSPVLRAQVTGQILRALAAERTGQSNVTVAGVSTADRPEVASLNTIEQLVNSGVTVDRQASDGTWHEIESITAGSPGNLVILDRETGFATVLEPDTQITYRVVNWSAPVENGTPNLWRAAMQTRPGIRFEVQQSDGSWRRVEDITDSPNQGRAIVHYDDGSTADMLNDAQRTYRVERGTGDPAPPQINPRDETDRALVFQRQDNDRYNRGVFERARQVAQENIGVADEEDEGIARLRELMRTYREASTNPNDPESVDAAIDDLVDELADWDIWFNSQGSQVNNHEDATAPQRPNYHVPGGPLPVGYQGPTLPEVSGLPRRTALPDLEPGQTLAEVLQTDRGSAYGSQRDNGIPPRYRQAIHDIYDYTDSRTGLRAEVNDAETNIGGGQVHLKGKIYDRDGNPVGNFTRVIGYGGPTGVRHSLFKLQAGEQGGGFTTRWFEQVKQQYRDQGMTYITVGANLDVGGYAWAKIGFDFENRYDARRLLERVERTGTVKLAVGELSDETMAEWEALQRRYDAGEWITPLEISQVGWRQRNRDEFDGYPRTTDSGDVIEMWLGKYVMLGSSWDGKLTL